MTDHAKEYWDTLLNLKIKAQDAFDASVLTLSGGALGVTFTFVKDLGGEHPLSPAWAFAAWISWAVSITAILFSHYTSGQAITQIMKGLQEDAQRTSPQGQKGPHTGGWYSICTGYLNFASGLFFLFGVVSMSVFAFKNLQPDTPPSIAVEAPVQAKTPAKSSKNHPQKTEREKK